MSADTKLCAKCFYRKSEAAMHHKVKKGCGYGYVCRACHQAMTANKKPQQGLPA